MDLQNTEFFLSSPPLLQDSNTPSGPEANWDEAPKLYNSP